MGMSSLDGVCFAEIFKQRARVMRRVASEGALGAQCGWLSKKRNALEMGTSTIETRQHGHFFCSPECC